MVWLSGISLVLFLALCYLITRKFQFDKSAIAGLLLKILAGISLGLIYKYFYKGGDTFQYFREASIIARFFLDHPRDFVSIYFDTPHVAELGEQIVFYEQPRALLFSKIISFFYVLTGGNYWMISAFLSLLNFVCIYFLVTELNKSYSEIRNAVKISFYFLPTFVFWTSGLLKESLTIGVMAVAFALVLRFIRTKDTTYSLWMYLVFLLWLLWELKYYYAAIAIPLLIAMLLYDLVLKRYSIYPIFILAIFSLGILLVSTLHYNLNLSRVFNVMYENYQLGIQNSENGIIRYYCFDGNWLGFLLNSPIALFSGLFRPTIFESNNVWQLIVALENLVVFCFLVIGLWKTRLQISGSNPLVIVALLFVVSLATLLAYTTPNLGTLSRYKEGYWPIFVLLVLVLFLKQQKRPDSHRI